MIEILRTSTQEEMIACFLNSEIDSSRFKKDVKHAIDAVDSKKDIILNPDLNNPNENLEREGYY